MVPCCVCVCVCVCVVCTPCRSELGGDGATSTDRLALTDEDTDTAKSGSSSKVWWGVVGALAIGGIALAAYAFSRKRGGSSASQRSTLRRGYR